MSAESTYIYATGDLLEERNTYTYTQYHGETFFADWREARAGVMRKLPSPAPCPAAIEARNLASILVEDVFDTGELLESILSCLQQGATGGTVGDTLARLVGRFEVSKRVHSHYLSRWRAAPTADYHNLVLYLRYAEVMELAYSLTENLVYLNVLLKVLDSLSATMDALPVNEWGRLARLLGCEQRYIERLLVSPE